MFWRRIEPTSFALAAAFMFATAHPVLAHPLGNFSINQFARIEPAADRVRVHYVADLAEIPAYQELVRSDADGDGHNETASFVVHAYEAVDANLDGRPEASRGIDVAMRAVDASSNGAPETAEARLFLYGAVDRSSDGVPEVYRAVDLRLSLADADDDEAGQGRDGQIGEGHQREHLVVYR